MPSVQMAKLKMDNKEKEIPDNSPIKTICEELGVIFGCEEGICGTCMIEVEQGIENLSELNQAEKDMGIEGKHRLACQCKIKHGEVKIRY